MFQKLSLVLPITLGSVFLALPSASAATCKRWVTQCTNKCTQQDEYGTCIAWSQDCTQVCGEWSTEKAPEEAAQPQIDEAALQKLFITAVSLYPKNAKSMSWHVDNTGHVLIDEVQK